MLGRLVCRLRCLVAQHVYIFTLVLAVLAGVFVVAIHSGWNWEIIVALAAMLSGVGGNLLANVIQGWRDRHQSARGYATQRAARGHYVEELLKHCQTLPLAALGGEEGLDRGPTLKDVYIALDTTTQVPRTAGASPRHRDEARSALDRDAETTPLAAIEAASHTARLVLLGDPGSGKSTFVRQLIVEQATAQLQGTALAPGWPADLLPILMTLRDLVPRLAELPLDTLADDDRRQALTEAVCAQTVDDLRRWQAEDYADGLREALTTGRCLLILDGFDEVPYALRQRVWAAVMAVLSRYNAQRVIVTCRSRSYVGEAVLPDFQAHTLAPFNADQITAFAQAWYNAQHTLGRMNATDASRRADNLARAAGTGALRGLAANPMLLTSMAIIHQRDTVLPEQRVHLYKLAVEILLRRWQQARAGEAGLTDDPALAAVLTDDQRLRPVLDGLAYDMHRRQQQGQTVDGLPRGDALALLEQPAYLGKVILADAFLDYVDQRAGILVGAGGAPGQPTTYSFPHRTFQEYLAACHLVGQRQPARALFEHTDEGEAWNLVAQLAAEELYYNRPRPHELLDLAYSLCGEAVPTRLRERRAVLWSGYMAALVGPEGITSDSNSPSGGLSYLQRLVPHLVALLGSDLSAPERADAGTALARLGDPRFRADAWFLPDASHVPLLGFCEIPAGPFLMGSADERDQWIFKATPPHRVILPTYYMARYPVTVAQFRTFVMASHYSWEHSDQLQGAANHPVVWVNWHDALAYCRWLTEHLRECPEMPEPLATLLRDQGWCVTLPSEAEWEKAARGTEGRGYPWGNDLDANRANCVGTGIYTTSTVGCFPGGVSPYGIEDMSGNVWEWTRSIAADYPYPTDAAEQAQREDRQASDDTPRVLRGGTFWDDRRRVRCASRGRFDARDVSYYVGFRVVVRP